jgi:hypothetical protein
MTKVVPRVHPVPENLEPYLLQANPVALEKMEDEVYRLVMLDVDPKAVIEQIEEDGWNREFVTWIANFTHAQRRPIRAISRAVFEHMRWWEFRLAEYRYYDSVTIWCGVAAALCGCLPCSFCPPIGRISWGSLFRC